MNNSYVSLSKLKTMKKKNVTISLSQEAIKRIKEIADKEMRSVSSMIEVLILKYGSEVKK